MLQLFPLKVLQKLNYSQVFLQRLHCFGRHSAHFQSTPAQSTPSVNMNWVTINKVTDVDMIIMMTTMAMSVFRLLIPEHLLYWISNWFISSIVTFSPLLVILHQPSINSRKSISLDYIHQLHQHHCVISCCYMRISYLRYAKVEVLSGNRFEEWLHKLPCCQTNKDLRQDHCAVGVDFMFSPEWSEVTIIVDFTENSHAIQHLLHELLLWMRCVVVDTLMQSVQCITWER